MSSLLVDRWSPVKPHVSGDGGDETGERPCQERSSADNTSSHECHQQTYM